MSTTTQLKIGSKFITVMYKNYVVIVQKRGNGYTVWVRSPGITLERMEIGRGAQVNPTIFQRIQDPGDRIAISDIINYITMNFDTIVEEEMLKALESIAKDPRINFVPKPPTDKERLISLLVDYVMRERTIRTFYIHEGGLTDRTSVLGVYCYDQTRGYYRECEEELKSEMIKIAQGIEWVKDRTVARVVEEAVTRIKGLTLTKLEYMRHALVIGDKIFHWDTFMKTGILEDGLTSPSPDKVVFHWTPWRIDIEKWKKVRKGLEQYIPPKNISEVVEAFVTMAPKPYEIFYSWVRSPTEPQEVSRAKIGLLLQIIGYCLYPHDYPFHKAILLVGEGGNGKSTYLGLIEKILGEWNVAHVPLSQLDPNVNRFAASALYGKLANVAAEPPTEYRGRFDPSLFKALTGEDAVPIERKYEDMFFAKNYAKLIFSANVLPELGEDTKAFWDRWIVIEFPNTFPRTMSRDEFLEKYLLPYAQEILICSIYAFYVALRSGGFTTVGAGDPKEEWLKRSNPIYAVVRAMIDDGLIVLDKNAKVSKNDLYQLYVKVCQDEGERCVDKRILTGFLERFYGIRSAKVKVLGKNLSVYVGIGITLDGYTMVDKPETPREWVIGAKQVQPVQV